MTDAQPPAPPPDWHVELEERLNRREQARLEQQAAKEAHGRLLKAWQDYCYASIGHPQEHTWHSFQRHWHQQQALDAYDGADDVVFNPFLAAKVDWQQLWDADTGPEWLLEPLLARGRTHAIFAIAGAGKSFITLAAAAALATGQPFLHKPQTEPISVLYCDYEMTPDDLRDRLTDFGYQPHQLTHLHYSLLPAANTLDTPEGAAELIQAARTVQAQAVIIDTAGRALQGDENESDTYRTFARLTMTPLKTLGVTVARVDHAGKKEEAGQRGSSAKNDDVDIVWRLTKTDSGRQLQAIKRRVNWVPETVTLNVTEHDNGLWTIDLPTSSNTWPEGTADAVRALEQLDVPIRVGANHAVKTLRQAGHGIRRQAVLAAVRYRKTDSYLAGTTFFAQPPAQTVPKPSHIQGTAGRTTQEPSEPFGEHTYGNLPPPIRGGSSQVPASLQTWIGPLDDL